MYGDHDASRIVPDVDAIASTHDDQAHAVPFVVPPAEADEG
jgi:hypothetical protein